MIVHSFLLQSEGVRSLGPSDSVVAMIFIILEACRSIPSLVRECAGGCSEIPCDRIVRFSVSIALCLRLEAEQSMMEVCRRQ